MKIFITCLIALLAIISPNTGFAQRKQPVQIKLEKHCDFDAQNRKRVGRLVNKIATVTREGSYIILLINEDKYMACNLPLTIKQKRIRVSGNVLETFQTERLIATPFKLTKATKL